MARFDHISSPIRSSEEDVKIVAVVGGWVVGIEIDGILLCSSHSVNISDKVFWRWHNDRYLNYEYSSKLICCCAIS